MTKIAVIAMMMSTLAFVGCVGDAATCEEVCAKNYPGGGGALHSCLADCKANEEQVTP